MVNTETKYIGTHNGVGIPNPIDQEDLKRSHVPIRSSDRQGTDKMSIYKSFYGATNNIYGSTKPLKEVAKIKDEYTAFKVGSEVSKVPFSPKRRNRVERTYNKFDKPNGYGSSVNKASFKWQAPTYDLK